MQGIAGIVYPDIFHVNQKITPMLEALNHRGKERSLHRFGNIEIGVCGGKIFKNKKSTHFVGFDGKLFYADAIRELLWHKGCTLPLHSDQEIILEAYHKFGIKMLQKLSGEFSIMLLDQHLKKLFLVRGRMGKKPLYWYHGPRHFVFGSELKALIASGVVPQTPCLEGLSSYLYFGFSPQDLSPIDKVNKLLPAHYMEFNLNGTKFIQSYWSFSSFFSKGKNSDLATIHYEINKHLHDVTLEILPKDDKMVGTFLSGGVGSASVASYLKQLAPEGSVEAYTVGFKGYNDQDLKVVTETAHFLDLPHKTRMITQANFLDDFVKIAWHLDEPIADPNVIATWGLAKLASENTRTVFSGMGSDELLAGHSRYSIEEYHMGKWRAAALTPLQWLQRLLINVFKAIYKPVAYRLLRQARTNPWQFEYMRQGSLFSEREISAASPRLAKIFDPEVFLHKFHRIDKIPTSVSSFLYFDIKTRLADSYILQYERLTAAFGLDWYSPYLDRQLAEYLAGLPEPDFMKEDEAASYLKSLMKGKLPDSIIKRPKKTRKKFLKDWMLSSEMRRIWLKLPQGTLVETGLISREWIFEMIDQLETEPKAFHWLWAILSLEVWYRLYIDLPPSSIPPRLSLMELLER